MEYDFKVGDRVVVSVEDGYIREIVDVGCKGEILKIIPDGFPPYAYIKFDDVQDAGVDFSRNDNNSWYVGLRLLSKI